MILNKRQLILVAVRLKSSRLERKALADLAGSPLIIRLFERLNEYIPRDNIVLCTSVHPQDSELYDLAVENGIQVYRGSELDVASRFIEAADIYGADTIVRVTGDNPLTDAKFILKMLESHDDSGAEYTFVSDLPIGTRAEVIDVNGLRRIRSEWSDPQSSEYMTLFLNRSDKFRQNEMVANCKKISRPELRLTVDTPEDLLLMQAIYSYFEGTPPDLSGVIEYLDANPNVRLIEDTNNIGSISDDIDCSYLGD
jgi:spore coat polysaccharide biosynthesis protein SpsF